MSFPAYEHSKDSGWPWIGILPSHWDVRRLKTLFSRVTRPVEDGDKIVTAFRDGQVTLRENRREEGFTNALQEIGYQGVRRGDLVIHAMDGFAGAIGVSDSDGKSTAVYTVCVAEPDASARYYALLLRHMALSGFVASLAKGIRERSTDFRWADASVLALPHPPLDEQVGILAFLDRETAKIDALVEAQRRLIELLKEKRQAVISHAVTKGLDPSAPMKDSGVEWLGQVPAHWEIRRFKEVCDQIVDCKNRTPEPCDESEFLVVRTTCVRDGKFDPAGGYYTNEESFEEWTRKGVPALGDVLFTREAPAGEACLAPSDIKFCLGQRMMFLRADRSVMLDEFLLHSIYAPLVREVVEGSARGSTVSHLRVGEVGELRCFCPPLCEQQAIVGWLKERLSEFDALSESANMAVEVLQERRAALISAAVTGKINVQAQAPVVVAGRDQVRLLVAAAVVDRLAHRQNFGRVKLQKLIYLAEAHVGVDELDGSYLRAAAGPLDRAMIEQMEASLEQSGRFAVSQVDGRGGQVSYRVLGGRGAFRDEARSVLKEREAKLTELIDTFADLDTKSTEAVATLYAAWNDLLQDGSVVSDDAIVSEVLTNWHPEKAHKFKRAELLTWLQWMRRRGLTPRGAGPRTTTGRLFV